MRCPHTSTERRGRMGLGLVEAAASISGHQSGHLQNSARQQVNPPIHLLHLFRGLVTKAPRLPGHQVSPLMLGHTNFSCVSKYRFEIYLCFAIFMFRVTTNSKEPPPRSP